MVAMMPVLLVSLVACQLFIVVKAADWLSTLGDAHVAGSAFREPAHGRFAGFA